MLDSWSVTCTTFSSDTACYIITLDKEREQVQAHWNTRYFYVENSLNVKGKKSRDLVQNVYRAL